MPLFKELGKWIKGWRLDKLLKKANTNGKTLLPIVIAVLEKFKKALASKAVDTANDIIQGEWDDIIVEKLRVGLPKLLLKLKMIESAIGIEDPIEQLKAILGSLEFSSDAERNAFLHSAGALILELLSDGDFSWGDSVVVVQLFYDYEHKKKEE